MLRMKDYQNRSLATLEEFMGQAAQIGASPAFADLTRRPYLSVPRLPGLPYVCLRVPTGGGKTVMACQALYIAANKFLQADNVVCLWLVPTNAILEQTLAALRNKQHAYRQVLDHCFKGSVTVMDLAEALSVQKATLSGSTCIIASTLAALRVTDTEGRKVYESAGALQHHFDNLEGLPIDALERHEGGAVKFSLANVLRLRRPVVIMDEAHNARTPLSFETLERFSPSCILEFTATPATEHRPEHAEFVSNVLHHVSAAELKAEHMVKLPIKLATHANWKEVVGLAVRTRENLEKTALEEERETGEYIRPIVLHQAQPRRAGQDTLTVEVLKQSLIEDFKVPEDHIAIATGDKRGIEDVNLLDRECRIRHIITVQALKEGWDCSFAYVLCSVADVGAARSVEQILGRTLRLPRAERKNREELNCAYAFAASSRFVEAAQGLADALIENGFEKYEAKICVEPADDPGLFNLGELPGQVAVAVTERPDLSHLPEQAKALVTYNAESGKLVLQGPVTDRQKLALQGCFRRPENRTAIEQACQEAAARDARRKTPSEEGVPFRVPQLAVRVADQLELFDDQFLEHPWKLADCEAALSEAEFPTKQEAGKAGTLDVSEQGKVEIRFVQELQERLAAMDEERGWTAAELATWLDTHIPHPDVPKPQSSLYLHRLVTGLLEARRMTVDQLARNKFRLRNAVQDKIDEHRKAARKEAFQKALFEDGAGELAVGPEVCFSYEADRYAPNCYYDGPYRWQKHYFPQVGELKTEGEEFECAQLLDSMPEVKFWVRNLERRDNASFWLQTSTDKFYPDFVALLNDGRIVVVEYKGADRWSNDDSKEKRAVGDMWAARSKGRCLFVMPKGRDWAVIQEKVKATASPH